MRKHIGCVAVETQFWGGAFNAVAASVVSLASSLRGV
jgi:hypothetical protein